VKVRALIVEDVPVVRELLIRLLQVSEMVPGWEFKEVGSGEEALSVFNPRHHDIVFLDWTLPAKSGTEVAMAIRARADAGHVALVMVTGRNTIGDIEIALDRVGVDAYITKPFDLASLRRHLKKPLERVLEHRASKRA
jgi:CheY-like chemotaxis protein